MNSLWAPEDKKHECIFDRDGDSCRICGETVADQFDRLAAKGLIDESRKYVAPPFPPPPVSSKKDHPLPPETEEEFMDRIFDSPKDLWKGKYRLFWCDLCETFSIGCPEPGCDASSCNCSSCEKCSADIDEFHKTKHSDYAYLNEQERRTREKIRSLKKWIERSLLAGEKELDWRAIHEQGWASVNEYRLFEELKPWREEVLAEHQTRMKQFEKEQPDLYKQIQDNINEGNPNDLL